MKGESTVLDALIGEMLGDVGKLLDAVQELKATLPQELETAEENITSLIGLLQRAGDAYRSEIKKYTQMQFEIARDQIQVDADSARRQISADAAASKQALDEAIKRVLSDIPKAVKSSMDSAMSKPAQQVADSLKQSTWKIVALSSVASAIGAALVFALKWLFK